MTQAVRLWPNKYKRLASIDGEANLSSIIICPRGYFYRPQGAAAPLHSKAAGSTQSATAAPFNAPSLFRFTGTAFEAKRDNMTKRARNLGMSHNV